MRTSRRSLLILIIILLPLSAHAQTSDDAADSLVRKSDELFEDLQTPPDSLLHTDASESTPLRRPTHGAIPEFSIRYQRADLLGLHDRGVFISYDRADGLYLGVGADLPARNFLERRLQGYLGVGYAFGSHYWQANAGLKRDFGPFETPLRVGVEGHIVTDTRDAWKIGSLENSLAAVIAGLDARDYFQRRGFSVSLEQYITSRISASATYRWDEYENSRREAGFSIFGPSQPFREVPPVREGRMRSIAARALVDLMTLRSWNDPQIGIEGEMEWGIGDVEFESLVVDARMKATLVDGTLWLAIRGRLGSATGDAPPQRRFTIGGIGTAAGYRQNEHEGNRMLLFESDLVIAPLGRFPNVRIAISNDAAWVATSPSDAPLIDFPTHLGQPLYSPGIYIASPALRIRIGVAWRTDRAETPVFVLRLGEEY